MSELTYIILDKSPAMAGEFKDASNYVLDLLISKVLRGKKQDKVGIATIHDTSTSNSMNARYSEQWLKCFVIPPTLYDWHKLMELKENRLDINPDPIALNEADLPRSLAISLQDIADKEGPAGKKTVRHSIIIVTNLQTKCSWQGIIEPICTLVLQYDIMIGVVYFPLSKDASDKEISTFKENFKQISNLISTVKGPGASIGRASKSFLTEFKEAQSYIHDFRVSPPRYVKPTSVFKGELRLFSEVNAIEIQDVIGKFKSVHKVSDYLPVYTPSLDPFSIEFLVEGYPFTKEEKSVITEDIGVKKDSDGNYQFLQIAHVRNRFVTEEENSTEKGQDKDTSSVPVTKPVTDNELQKGYRYGSSVVPATTSIQTSLQIPSFTGIDIISFVKKNVIPPWYYRGEVIMILPAKSANSKDVMAYNMFVQGLLNDRGVAIVRMVQKPGRAPVLGALIPTMLLTPDMKTRVKKEDEGLKRTVDDSVNYYGLSMVSLVFKNEERFPPFSNLRKIAKEATETDPSEEMVTQMDNFVDMLDLDKLNDEKPHTEWPYSEFGSFDTLPVPWNEGIEVNSASPTLDKTTRKILMQNSSKFHSFENFIREIYHFYLDKAKDNDSLFKLVEDSKTNPVPKDGRTSFDIVFDKLEKETTSQGRNLFVPDLYDKQAENPALKSLQESMVSLFDCKVKEQSKSKKTSQTPEDQAAKQAHLTPITELLHIH